MSFRLFLAETATLSAHPLFLLGDDATVVGTHIARVGCMVAKSLADRMAELEAKVGNKTLEEQFRDQAEMLDERFAQVHERLDGLATDVGVLKADATILKVDVGHLKVDVGALKVDVSTLKKDVAIIREGMGIVLKKLR